MARRRRDDRSLHLKLRVVLTEVMPRDVAMRKVWKTIQTRTVQPGIEIAWVDWRKGEGYHSVSGRLTDDAIASLMKWYRAIMHGGTQTRIEVVGE